MANRTLTPSTPPLTGIDATLAELRTLAAPATPRPDARLVTACERFVFLWDQSNRLYRIHPRGFMKQVRATMAERDALEHEIVNTPARTVLGRLAKAEAALPLLMGTYADIARSALKDFAQAASFGADAGRA